MSGVDWTRSCLASQPVIDAAVKSPSFEGPRVVARWEEFCC